MVPTFRKCYEIQDAYNMMSISKGHSENIKRVASRLVSILNWKGYKMDGEVMEASALLHDITKVHQVISNAIDSYDVGTLNKHMNYVPTSFAKIYEQANWMKKDFKLPDNVEHTESGYHLLKHLGYEEIGDIIRRHNEPLVEISEMGILCYADRIVAFDIIPLDERFKYINRKYGDRSELHRSSKELERLLLSTAGITFEDLKRMHHG
ncbi:MAG: HD domain-containing protein [Candidatus Woesearchaeota archaeon]